PVNILAGSSSNNHHENWSQALQVPNTIAHIPTIMDIPTIIATFDSLPPSLQSYLLFHLLRRCTSPVLQYISSVILTNVKRDFLGQLPTELCLNILQYLDGPSLCRAAQVSKRWRNVIDADSRIWRRRFELDGFKFEEGEEQKALFEQLGTETNYGLPTRILANTQNA